MKDLNQLLAAAKERGPKKVAVAAAGDGEVLEAIKGAGELGLATAFLVGDQRIIEAEAARVGLNLRHHQIIHEADAAQAGRKAVSLVSSGEADMAMKGLISTGDFLRAVLDKEIGLRTGRALSHVAAVEVKGYERLIFVTDVAMNIAPDLNRKVEIIQNALGVTRALGLERPKVAALAAVETVSQDMPATVDAALLAKMSERGQIKGAIIDGPLALDNAISAEAAEHKGIKSPVAGAADILLVPSIDAGNVLYKSMVYFAGARSAGIVAGAAAPIILLSRADSHESKMLSIALARLTLNN